MEFGAVPLSKAEGAILAHSVRVGGLRLKKGVTLDATDIAALREAGIEAVTVARLGFLDVHEDAAAARLAAAVLEGGNGLLRASKAATGRVNLYAETRGVLRVDPAAVNAVNRIDPAITLATLPMWQHVGEGAMVATVKVIAYGVAGTALSRAEAAAPGALTLCPTTLRTATLIQTTVGGDRPEPGHDAIAARMERLGLDLAPKVVVPHDEALLAQALSEARGDLVLILTASATSDLRDVAPAAVIRAGGRVLHYGMPVDPGNLLFLGHLGAQVVVGLPGCARSPALNGADWVLERVACGVDVSAEHIMEMGVGGLLKEIPTRPRPREGRPRR